jgi:indolepyruvate ferredoxin oxidoreductase
MTGEGQNGTAKWDLMDRYTVESGRVYLSGLQALVRLLLDQQRVDARAGLRTGTIVSGYPGSPVGGFDSELRRNDRFLREHDVVFVPGLNEDLAATAVFGSQLAHVLPGPRFDGVLGMWFGKAPGVDRSADALRHGMFRGVAPNGGIIAVAGDDPAPKSSILSSDSTAAFYDLMMPVIYPGDIQDLIDLGLHAFALSRASGLGVGMKLVADVADSAGTVDVGPGRVEPILPTVMVDGQPFQPHFDTNLVGAGMREPERLYLEGRLEVARAYARENRLNPVSGALGDNARLGIVAAGKTYLDLMEALRKLGLGPAELERHGVRLKKMGLLFPLDRDELREFAGGVDEVLVIEEKRGFVELFFKEALFGVAAAPRVVGKRDEAERPLVPQHAVLGPESIAELVAARLDPLVEGNFSDRAQALRPVVIERRALPIARIGTFCSGCPHTSSLKTPDGMIVGGGIGCHTMAIPQGREEFGEIIGYTQMGGEGAQWVGALPFTETSHLFQNVGDGTFAHSGSMAIRFAVSAKANVTYKLLFNSAVAMTGGQPAVGGKDVVGTIQLLLDEGVSKVVVTTDEPHKYRGVKLPHGVSVRHRDEILDVERELAEVEGVTVLLHDQQCAIEKRRARKRGTLAPPARHVVINERVCEGCGDCGRKSSCLSVIPVETEFGRKTQIHQSSCSNDMSCLAGDCPSFLTVKVRGDRTNTVKPDLPEMPAVELPEPERVFSDQGFQLHMSGIGGTGVITVNQILGIAGAMEGLYVRALDQFGGSQKAGGVTSHLKLSATPPEHGGEISEGAADTLLIFDVLVATEHDNLAKADPARTRAVVSTDKVATGSMIVDTGLSFPQLPVFSKAIDANTVAADNVYLDAQGLAEKLLGNHLATNLLLTGAAYQRGLIPISPERIEEAIELNGVAVAMNVAAFRWGRLLIAEPELVERATATPAAPKPAATLRGEIDPWADGELNELVGRRSEELIAYQDVAYARSYIGFVREAAEAERRAGAEGDEIAKAVGLNLFKLMAYKDEYEVARLHLMNATSEQIREEFGPDAKVFLHLHPPLLRAMGMKRKLVLGPWFTPALKGLARMKGLRGTALDPFGRAHVRRLERELIDDYRETMRACFAELEPERVSVVAEIAALPDMIRGYEEIKTDNVEQYRRRRTELLDRLHGGGGPIELPVVQSG